MMFNDSTRKRRAITDYPRPFTAHLLIPDRANIFILTVCIFILSLFFMPGAWCQETGDQSSEKNRDEAFYKEIEKKTGFDHLTFKERVATAQWLFQYDTVAWITSDMVEKETDEIRRKMGEWFCLEYNGDWYALYGKYDTRTDHLNIAIQYVFRKNKFERTEEVLPSKTIDAMTRALAITRARLEPILTPLNIVHNQYIRPINKDRLEVWWFPAWQNDGRLFAGTEYRIVTDNEGQKIIEESIPNTKPYEIRPDNNGYLIFPNDNADVPTVGNILDVFIFKKRVNLVGIRSRKFTSVFVDMPNAEGPAWIHAENSKDLMASIKEVQDTVSNEKTKWTCHPKKKDTVSKDSIQSSPGR